MLKAVRLLTVAISPIIVFAGTLAASAADFNDPTWPCAQRKVANMSVGAIWPGPPIDDAAFETWRDDTGVAALASALSIRRTSMEDAEALIGRFAEGQDAAASEKLPVLFAGVFSLIDRERGEIISGISRYSSQQNALSEKVSVLQDRLAELNGQEPLDFDRIEEVEDQLEWDLRIFNDRKQSLQYVCLHSLEPSRGFLPLRITPPVPLCWPVL